MSARQIPALHVFVEGVVPLGSPEVERERKLMGRGD